MREVTRSGAAGSRPSSKLASGATERRSHRVRVRIAVRDEHGGGATVALARRAPARTVKWPATQHADELVRELRGRRDGCRPSCARPSASTRRTAAASKPRPAAKPKRRPSTRPSVIRRVRRATIASAMRSAASQGPRQPESAREHARAAARDRAERRRPARAAVQHLVDGAVSAEHDDQSPRPKLVAASSVA